MNLKQLFESVPGVKIREAVSVVDVVNQQFTLRATFVLSFNPKEMDPIMMGGMGQHFFEESPHVHRMQVDFEADKASIMMEIDRARERFFREVLTSGLYNSWKTHSRLREDFNRLQDK